MFRYQGYGLKIDSDVSLPELLPLPDAEWPGAGEISVRLAVTGSQPPKVSGWTSLERLPDGKPWLRRGRLADGYLVRYVGLADFTVNREGTRVVCCSRSRQASPATIRHLLLDQVLPVVLNLRGQEALHAAAVITPRGAIAFTGPAGVGKSTLAAEFATAGYIAMGDDCLALGHNGEILAIPAYPGIRLWKDSSKALAVDSGLSGPVAHYTSKRRVLGAESAVGFPTEALPLAGVYRLSRGIGKDGPAGPPSITRLRPREAFVELVSTTFVFDATDRAILRRHFGLLTEVAARVPVMRLRMRDDFSTLEAARDAVLGDLGIR